MKKIAILSLIILGSFFQNTYAQEPTKQETMDWLVSKMLAFKNPQVTSYLPLSDDPNSFSFTEYKYYSNYEAKQGSIVYTSNYGTVSFFRGDNYSSSADRFNVITFNLANINAVEVGEKEGKKQLIIKGNDVYSSKVTREGTIYSDSAPKFYLNIPKYDSNNPKNYYTQTFIEFDAEPDLFNRMLKAFQTLAKYNNEGKPKEKF